MQKPEKTVAERRIADMQRIHDHFKLGQVNPSAPFAELQQAAKKLGVADDGDALADIDSIVMQCLTAIQSASKRKR